MNEPGRPPRQGNEKLENILLNIISTLERELKSVEDSNKTFMDIVRSNVGVGDIQEAEETALFIAKEEAYASSIRAQLFDYRTAIEKIRDGCNISEYLQKDFEDVFRVERKDSYFKERAREIVCEVDAELVYKEKGDD